MRWVDVGSVSVTDVDVIPAVEGTVRGAGVVMGDAGDR